MTTTADRCPVLHCHPVRTLAQAGWVSESERPSELVIPYQRVDPKTAGFACNGTFFYAS